MNAVLLSLILNAGMADVPVVTHLEDGGYKVSSPAWLALDSEIRRLQAVEAKHQEENWPMTIIISASIGLLVGAGTVAVVAALIPPKTSGP